jgi:hypothetical protein
MQTSLRFLLVAGTVMATNSSPAIGQSRDAAPAGHQASLCFRPKPIAQCQAFVFLDATGALGVFRAPRSLGTLPLRVSDFPTYAAGSIGYMSNVDSSHAIGAGLEVGGGTVGRASLKLHWRRWYPGASSLDVSAGVLATDFFALDASACQMCDTRARAYGLTGDVALFERHGLGLFAGVDVAHGAGRTSAGLHAGARLEGYPALAAAVGTAAGFALVWTALRNGNF